MPGTWCSVIHCTNNTFQKNKRFYRFPKDKNRCLQWIEILGISDLRKKSPSKWYNNYRVCEDHFSSWCFMNSQDKQHLVHNALPLTPHKPVNVVKNTDSFLMDSLSEDFLKGAGTHDDSSTMLDDSVIIHEVEEANIPISDLTTGSNEQAGMFSGSFSAAVAETSTSLLNSLMEDGIEENKQSLGEVVCLTSTPTHKMSQKRKNYTPRKLQMARELKRTKDSLRWYKAQHKPKKIKKSVIKEELVKCCIKPKLANFLIRQMDLSAQKSKSHRFTFEEKLFAYNVVCKSKNAYRALQSLITLPSESTLRRFVARKITRPGVNQNVLNSIETLFRTRSLPQRTCALVFDEMAIKPKLTHNPVTDNVCGFEDFGELGRSQKVATQALVFMIRTLQGKKKLPICFYLSNGSVSSDYLKIITDSLIEKLTAAGVNIKALICDQASSNCGLFRMLGIDEEKPYFEKNGEKIFGIFDPPHLLKTLRRNLMTNDLMTPRGAVSFQHIVEFYNEDRKRFRHLAPRLNDKHINAEGLSSMNVKIAAQIFSNSVAAGMSALISGNLLPARSAATAHFVGMINDLFDTCNGNSKYPRGGAEYRSAASDRSPHLQFWSDTYEELKKSHFVPSSNPNQPPKKKKVTSKRKMDEEIERSQFAPSCSTDQPPKKKRKITSKGKMGWALTINAMRGLYDELKNSGFEYMMTSRLNQDCLENYFSQIRSLGGHNCNPTAYEFHSSFKIACVNTLTNVKKNKNCQDDDDSFLIELIKAPSEEEMILTDEEFDEVLENLESKTDSAEDKFDFVEENVIAYLAGYVAKRVLEEIKCQTCSSLLTDQEKKLTNSTIFISFKQYLHLDIEQGLTYPSAELLKCIMFIIYLCDELFCDILYKDKVLCITRKAIEEKADFKNICKCAKHGNIVKSKIIEIISKLCLKIHLRELNKSISKNNLNLKSLREAMKKKSIYKQQNLVLKENCQTIDTMPSSS